MRHTLDLGDTVTCRSTGALGVVTCVEVLGTGERAYTVEWAQAFDRVRHSRCGWSREELEREYGNLQVGDWVYVTGECEQRSTTDVDELNEELGVIVDDYAEAYAPDFLVFCPGEGRAYECTTAHLTRITRAEALA
ncbi:hypothetical protein DAETH_28600 [Deinococcus aetherius]|uniref:Uncharacterized protein n=1 Tax=Deinococcus aetherius TaxID=200252 RepID=A0ABN6RKT2_9DEIO|nr:hypothetical protein [Deinococcus aetherius]BDP42891.1 hypothetical protein DAETH_28600 [Deinococcus aetherius]